MTAVRFSVRPLEKGYLRIDGELDDAAADEVFSRVRTVLDEHPSVLVLDLSGVTFLDCGGLSALSRVRVAAASQGTRFELRGPSRAVRRLMRLTGTAGVFGVDAAADDS